MSSTRSQDDGIGALGREWMTDVVHIQAKDGLRYGYRVWSEKKDRSGDPAANTGCRSVKTLEQSAFSRSSTWMRLSSELCQAQSNDGANRGLSHRAAHHGENECSPAQGWAMNGGVARIQARRLLHTPGGLIGWRVWQNRCLDAMDVFTDGLATVSLFVERFDPSRHRTSWRSRFGRRYPDANTQARQLVDHCGRRGPRWGPWPCSLSA